MPYSEVLAKMIQDSKLPIKEIANLCKEQGLNITPSYISQLKSGKVNPPSDEVSRAISKICGVDEEKLVIEAYLDKSPRDILEYIQSTRFSMVTASLTMYENIFPPELLQELKQTLSNLSLADFILEINKSEQLSKSSVNNNIYTSEYHSDDENFNLNISLINPMGIPVKDNSMYPLIPEGSLITCELKDNYNDGDILYFKVIETNDFFIRKCFIQSENFIFIPLNTGYESLTIEKSNIQILGKVKKVIKEI